MNVVLNDYLKLSSSIEGVIKREDKFHTVLLFPCGSDVVLEEVCISNGKFKIKEVPPGYYQIEVISEREKIKIEMVKVLQSQHLIIYVI